MQINRLFEMIYILLSKKSITAKELAERFEVSVRTIYRDIDTLSSAGIPIYASQGRGGGISLLDDYVLDKSVLSEREQNEILYALQSLAITQAPETEQVLAKLSSLFNKNKTSWIEVDFRPWGSDENRTYQFTIIKDAILSRRIIEFNYFSSSGEKSIRRVEPVKLVFKVSAWYLKAFCLTRNTFRIFKITRMSDVLMTPVSCSENDFEELPESDQEQKTQKWIDVCLKISAQKQEDSLMDDFNPMIFDQKELSGRRVLVTGGTKGGIGEAIAKRLTHAGATVITTARHTPDESKDSDLFIQADISTPHGTAIIVENILERFGGVDILVNNVGGSSTPTGSVLKQTDAGWQQTFETNLFAAVRLDRGLLPPMLKQGYGVIIHVTSIQRRFPGENTMAYSSAKAALANFRFLPMTPS